MLKEFLTTDTQIQQIKQVGGMVGLRTGPTHILKYPRSGVKNDCPGSSKSYAQMVAYARDKGIDIAFGSDFNGVTQQGRRIDDTGFGVRNQGADGGDLVVAISNRVRDG